MLAAAAMIEGAAHELARAAPVTLDELVRDHYAYVQGVARRILGSREDAEDVAQDVFCAATIGHAALREAAAARAWLTTITVRKAMRRLRWLKVRRSLGLMGGADVDALVDPTTSGAHRDRLRRLYRVLDTLTVAERTTWILAEVEREPLRLIAETVGCSLATVKRRLSVARLVVEEALDA